VVTHSREYERLVKGLFRHPYPQSDEPGPYRAVMAKTAKLFTRPDDIAFRTDTIAGIPVEWIDPPGARPDALLVYLHGGGYYMGGIETYRHYVARFAQIAGLRAVHLEYRLAPEHPYPAAIEDTTAVVRALHRNFTMADRIVIAGDSAGGGLTLATLIALRDEGHPLPKAAAVISPWTDLTSTAPSIEANRTRDPVLGNARTKISSAWYARGMPLTHPRVSPLFADFTKFPPLLVQVGTEEILFDDSVQLAERAKAQGAPVELEVWEGMVHVWHYYAEWIPEGREGILRIADFFTKHLG